WGLSIAVLAGAWLVGCGGDDSKQAAVTPWSFVQLAAHSAQDEPVLAGDEVIVGFTRRGQAALKAYPVAGGAGRLLSVPGSEESVIDLAASGQAVAVDTVTLIPATAAAESSAARNAVPAAFGPRSGPLERFPFHPDELAVAGSFALAFEFVDPDKGPSRLTRWDTSSPASAPRELRVPAGVSGVVDASGDYVAVFLRDEPDSQVVVMDVRSGSEVYRVPADGYAWSLAPDGRLVAARRAEGAPRIITATPQEPALREIARVPLAAPRVSAAPTGAIVARLAANGLAQLALVGYDGYDGYDGSVRLLSPPLNNIDDFDFDGTHVTFNAGHCVFTGTLPAGDPGPAPRDACFDASASIDSGWMDRNAQVSGAVLRVGLRCVAPVRARCRTRLRLRGPGFTADRRVKIGPGFHVAWIPIPARHRKAAWRTGMGLSAFERGRVTAGMVIPQ
ncbi:MAG TPA: hypothetical protein VK631_20250, partial [Solirubrobacteraceae bacterium]|nr:hypothetical protein [Solirubrobacteraceae bacterium]